MMKKKTKVTKKYPTSIKKKCDFSLDNTSPLDKNSNEIQESEETINTIPLLPSCSILKSPVRFNIMMLLHTFTRLRNKTLCKNLHITPGNLDHHSKKLIEQGWIRERFVFEIRPLKVLEITSSGKEEFYQHLTELKRVLKDIPLY